jgi:FAD:protein FMN transferase
LLDYAAQLHELSGGKFDITSGVLRRVWRFDGSDRVPKPAAVKALLPIVGWNRVRWRSPEIALLPGMQVDLGGIGKEYAVDRAAALIRPLSAYCLLNFGGDLLALGPSAAGRPWRVGIEALADTDAAAKQIDLSVGAPATPGATC